MPDLSKRSAETEIMDDLEASGPVIDVTLRELETINLLLGGNHVTIGGIRKLLPSKIDRPISIVDVGCGSGDILRLVNKSLTSADQQATLTGIDANPNIVEYARTNTPQQNITFRCLNIFSDAFRALEFDILLGTLFFHHFTDDELVEFLARAKSQAKIGIVINDIHRHWFAYHSIKWLTRIFSKSEMVRNDAAVSVMRSFKKDELEQILKRAGIEKYSIRWMWAFRWQVVVYC
jgi:2-polyprenyl-3-methyl-5-hydroxy-6-metoxy-1,4-benzoquinol methylase